MVQRSDPASTRKHKTIKTVAASKYAETKPSAPCDTVELAEGAPRGFPNAAATDAVTRPDKKRRSNATLPAAGLKQSADDASPARRAIDGQQNGCALSTDEVNCRQDDSCATDIEAVNHAFRATQTNTAPATPTNTATSHRRLAGPHLSIRGSQGFDSRTLDQDWRGEDLQDRNGFAARADAPHSGDRRNLALSSGLGASVIGLVRTIEDEILPRLKVALDTVNGNPCERRPTFEQVGELARLSITRDETASQLYVEHLLELGLPLDALHEGLLVDSARRLGEFWIDDLCDFSDVTVGLIRLQKIQRSFSKDFRSSGSSRAATAVSRLALRRALIVPMPGEQHTFGASLVQDHFARAGWEVTGWPPSSDADLVAMVRQEAFDMVGLTVSRDERLSDLAAVISLVRRACRNRHVVIAVGGPPFLTDPRRAAAVGADATGSTGPEAVAAVDAAMVRVLGSGGGSTQ